MNMVSKQGFFDALEPNAQEIAAGTVKLLGRRSPSAKVLTPRTTPAFIARATREWLLATNPARVERSDFARKMCESKVGVFWTNDAGTVRRVYFNNVIANERVMFDAYFDIENGGFFNKNGRDLTEFELTAVQKLCGVYVAPVVAVTSESVAEIVEIRTALEAAAPALQAAGEVAAIEQTTIASEEQKITALVNTCINRPLIDRCLKIMAANHNPANRIAKSKFEDARVLISKERAKLASAGFRCAALGIAATANVNRPERDSVTQITAQNWLDISRIEAE